MTRKKVLSVTAGMTLASLIVGSASTEAATYTVKKGDSLWKISQQYHTTVSQIKSDNHLTGDIIYPNQKFKVPSQTPKKYKIVSGDTLSAIAKKYGVKVSQLKEWNHLNSDLIYAGDILKINSSSATTSSTANSTGNSTANSTSNSTANNSTANNTTANSSTANNTAKSAATQRSTAPNGTYQIVKGDTLSGVAQKFGVTVSQLKEWNHLSSDWIVAGSALKVDGPSSAASSSNGSSTQSNQSSGTASSSSNAGSASSQTSGSSSTQSGSSNNSGSTTNSSQASQSSGAASSSQASGSTSSSQSSQSSSAQSSSSNAGSSSSSSASTSSSRAVSKNTVSSSSNSGSYSGSAVAQIAQKYIGAPYRFGGTTPAGFDCSGFVYYVLNEAGKSIGRLDAAGFYSNSYRVSNPQPGDLIFFENTYKSGISDVGIYLGNNQFISDSDKSVSIKSLDNSYWKSHFNSIRRLY
ncbi:LysM peptidoglycan-binding domain-containing protein [Heyndrickxia coagulans]|uniref:C40 family peptidase n=1 Tax=Heyndrickxia coagulans TaxID=1398 RepID=UPI0028F7A9AA|nr:LysM peptidoglycan-binding domain-containing protein [Heyndrickxia coagulans]MDT9757032.1 LysM peptidoglycan-binding domain-containing protein [Heyndrickxia coagulans]